MNITYHCPEKILRDAEVTMDEVASEKLFNKPEPQKLFEQWCAGKFGVGFQKYTNRKCTVGVNNTDTRLDADFFLRIDGKELAFQVVEVQVPSRKRGDEYKRFANGSISIIHYNPDKGRQDGPSWIKAGIEKKVKKHYAQSEDLNLLVYANFMARELEYASLKQALAQYKDSFASVWIITSTHICSIHTNEVLGEIAGWYEFSPVVL